MVSLHLPSWQGISTCHLRSEASTAHCRKNPSDLNGSQWISESRFAWTPEPKWFFSMPGRFPFFSQSKQKQYLIPCLYRCGTGSYPHKCCKLLDRSVLEFPLFKRADYGNSLHSGVSLTSCNWKLKIQFNIYSFLFAAKDHTVCFGIDVIQGCPTYCTYRSFIELSQAPICTVCQTSNFGCNLI